MDLLFVQSLLTDLDTQLCNLWNSSGRMFGSFLLTETWLMRWILLRQGYQPEHQNDYTV